jgi:hypothetical protein
LALFLSILCSFVCLFLFLGTYDDFVTGHLSVEAACKYCKTSIIITIIIIITFTVIIIIIIRDI